MNDALNGFSIQAWRNQPNHNIYDTRVQALLNSISSDLNPNETAQALESIITLIRGAIEANPTQHLNNLLF